MINLELVNTQIEWIEKSTKDFNKSSSQRKVAMQKDVENETVLRSNR